MIENVDVWRQCSCPNELFPMPGGPAMMNVVGKS
jgi:hypothetical protein